MNANPLLQPTDEPGAASRTLAAARVPRPGLAYVVHSLNPGGTEKLVVEMSLAFADEFDVLVICLDEPGTWAADLRARGISVHCVWRQNGLDIAIPRKLAAHFRRHGTRIVHAHQCTPWFYAALARLSHSAPRLLLEEHGRFYPEVRSRARATVNRLLIRPLTHRFVAVSADVRARLEQYEGLRADHIEVIHNGVAPAPRLTPAERETLRRELGFGPESFVVGTVGRLDPIKNLPMLVDSLARARATLPSVRGLLVGGGPMDTGIRERIARAGLTQDIHLTGFRNDARRLAQCMDLFVLSSFSEGISMAVLEAMSVGVPVALTAVGGNTEVVIGGETGWLVPSGSVEELTRVILEAATDSPKRQKYAAAGRRRFEECFQLERMIASYRRQYRELLAAPA